MNLKIKKDKRAKGKFVQRTGGAKGITKTKPQALKDIKETEKECYIDKESLVFKALQYSFIIIPFNI